jgi:hypothetical protein
MARYGYSGIITGFLFFVAEEVENGGFSDIRVSDKKYLFFFRSVLHVHHLNPLKIEI